MLNRSDMDKSHILAFAFSPKVKERCYIIKLNMVDEHEQPPSAPGHVRKIFQKTYDLFNDVSLGNNLLISSLITQPFRGLLPRHISLGSVKAVNARITANISAAI